MTRSAATSVSLSALIVLSAFTAFAARPALAGAASGAPTGSVSLVSQTPWVTSTSGMTIDLSVKSTLPRAELGLQLTVFNEVTERLYFEQTVNDDTTSFTALPTSPGVMPLTATKGLIQPDGTALVVLRLAPPAVPGKAVRAPANGAVLSLPCGNQCDGVWPLQVSLVDLTDYTPLDKFMTYLVVAPHAASSPLRFSWVLPLGQSPSLSPSGSPSVSSTDETELSTIDSALARNPGADLSVALYPQLVDGLAAAATAPVPKANKAAVTNRNNARLALSTLHRLLGRPNVELEQSTYTPTNLAALAGSHLDTEAATQIGVGRTSMASLGVKVDSRPFVAPTPIGPEALRLLATSGVKQLIVPNGSATAVSPSTWDYPVWAPFKVRNSPVVVDESDYFLERHLVGSGTPVLRAYQLLADLAMLYFVEQPPGNRGVTLLTPPGWQPSSAFLSTVLSGLSSSQVLRSVPLSQFFSQVPAGSDETPILYRGVTAGSIPAIDGVPAGSVARARVDIGALTGMLAAHSSTIARLDRLVLLGETIGLQPTTRRAYFRAAAKQLAGAARSVSLPAPRTITITSLSAKVPISLYSRARMPLNVHLLLYSCRPSSVPEPCASTDLTFGHSVYQLALQPGNHIVEVRVSTRSSGDFILYLQLTTPSGYVLAGSRLTIRSTAISGVAVVLTVGAGAFLLVWWARSAWRRRRGSHARGRAAVNASVP
jgi:hypothetical protein